MISKQLSNSIILNPKIWQFKRNEFAKTIVIEGDEQIPIDIFGHWYFYLFLLIAFDVVDLHEDEDVEKLN